MCQSVFTAGIDERKSKALKILQQQGIKSTEMRELVFDALNEAKKPLSVYEVMDYINSKRFDKTKRTSPSSTYRMLEILIEAGLAYNLKSINSFVAKNNLDCVNTAYLICSECNDVFEYTSNTLDDFYTDLEQKGFAVADKAVEKFIVCPDCQV